MEYINGIKYVFLNEWTILLYQINKNPRFPTNTTPKPQFRIKIKPRWSDPTDDPRRRDFHETPKNSSRTTKAKLDIENI